MKKQFAAAAAMALSGAASAQTSVTLYGLIDTGIGYANVDGSYTDPATGRRSSIDNSRKMCIRDRPSPAAATWPRAGA